MCDRCLPDEDCYAKYAYDQEREQAADRVADFFDQQLALLSPIESFLLKAKRNRVTKAVDNFTVAAQLWPVEYTLDLTEDVVDQMLSCVTLRLESLKDTLSREPPNIMAAKAICIELRHLLSEEREKAIHSFGCC